MVRAWPSLEVALEAFLDAKLAGGMDEDGLERCVTSVRRLMTWAQTITPAIVHPFKVTSAHLQAYHAYLAECQGRSGILKPETVHWKLARLKVFYKWACKEGYLEVSPFEGFTMPAVRRQYARLGLTQQELDAVLAVPDLNTLNGIRVRAILEVFYSTGIRLRELAHLKLRDVNPARGVIVVRKGKGRKDRVVPIGEQALYFLSCYLRVVRPVILKGVDQGYLFLSCRGTPFHYYTTLSMLVRRCYDRAGIQKEGACHLLRHSAATHMLQGGADIREVQEFLGHAWIDTTAGYTAVVCGDLKDVLKRCHPLERGDDARSDERGDDARSDERGDDARSDERGDV